MSESQIIEIIKFWLSTVDEGQLYEREILGRIDCKSKEIIDLIGPRRSGKSSIFKLLIKKLNLKNNFLFINFEDPFFIENNKPQVIEELVEVFQEYFNKNLRYLFFDEIQKIDKWESVIRKFRDSDRYKIFITGSSSKLLSGEIATLLTGRHLSYSIFPLSFREFLQFNDIKLTSSKDIILKEKLIKKEFGRYLNIGGFPAIVLSNQRELLKNYFFDILEKDVIARHQIREKDVLKRMAIYLFSNSGKIFTIESLKNIFNISFESASLYVSYLREAFILFELPQFGFSLKRQEKALKKIYTIDSGLANNVSFKFSEDKGRVLENVVFLHLRKNVNDLFYYKTRKNSEVDFLVKEKEQIKDLIQVCWSFEDENVKEREIKSLLEAMKELNLEKGFILTNSDEGKLKFDGKMIIVKPVYRWLLEF